MELLLLLQYDILLLILWLLGICSEDLFQGFPIFYHLMNSYSYVYVCTDSTSVPFYPLVLTDEQTGHYRAGYCTLKMRTIEKNHVFVTKTSHLEFSIVEPGANSRLVAEGCVTTTETVAASVESVTLCHLMITLCHIIAYGFKTITLLLGFLWYGQLVISETISKNEAQYPRTDTRLV